MNIFTQNYWLRAWKARHLGQVLQRPLNGQELELNHLCQRAARFMAYSYSPKVDMSLAEVRKVVVEKRPISMTGGKIADKLYDGNESASFTEAIVISSSTIIILYILSPFFCPDPLPDLPELK